MILELISVIMLGHGFFIFFIPLACCLKILNIQVPDVIDVRSLAELKCNYELGGDRLYSLKWYKEEWEFFRYMPHNSPQVQTFKVEGITVAEHKSNATVITLSPLEYKSTGFYKCEVSSERPHFKTDLKGANMTVLGLPRDEPRIEGINPSLYSPGEYVTGNCTSSPSNPPAKIEWFINDKKANEWFIERYEQSTADQYDLKSITLALRFRIEPEHFISNNHIIQLSCQATVAGTRRSRVANVKVNSLTNQKFSQEQHSNGGARLVAQFLGLFILLLKLL